MSLNTKLYALYVCQLHEELLNSPRPKFVAVYVLFREYILDSKHGTQTLPHLVCFFCQPHYSHSTLPSTLSFATVAFHPWFVCILKTRGIYSLLIFASEIRPMPGAQLKYTSSTNFPPTVSVRISHECLCPTIVLCIIPLLWLLSPLTLHFYYQWICLPSLSYIFEDWDDCIYSSWCPSQNPTQ